jgi:hypothetical protein
MNLRTLVQVLRRRWYLVLIGVALGGWCAFLGAYQVTFGGSATHPAPAWHVRLTHRSFKTYRTVLAVVIDAPNAALGRMDIPMAKTVELAPTYAYMATDDSVMRALESKYGRPLQAKLSAVPVENSPIVQLSVEGKDPAYITRVAATAQRAFISELEAYQRTNGIPEDLRIVVRPLGPASRPELVVSREYEIVAILFLLPVAAMIGLALFIDNWSRGAQSRESKPTLRCAIDPDASGPSEEAMPLVGTAAGSQMDVAPSGELELRAEPE